MAIAQWYDATITLLHVCADVPAAAYAPGSAVLPSMVLTTEDREQMAASMAAFATTEPGPSVSLEFEVARGSAAAEILARVDATRPDLLVLGTHGRSGFERLVLGSVTEKVLRKATCPVLSVPPRDAVPASTVLFKRILCAIDFSDCSMRALNYAMSLAQQADARLTVVHVIELPPEVPDTAGERAFGPPRSLREYVADAETDRRERLTAAIPEAVRAYCTVDTTLATGKPYREILRIADEQQCDLIVIGIHGRGAADLLFFGSTAQHVVRRAACPVLTLRTE